MKPEEAIESAIRTLDVINNQPYFGDEIPLRHLWDALEKVSGLPDQQALAELYRSLSTGELPADGIKDPNKRRAIPSHAWPKYDANNNTWYCGVIYWDRDLPTFIGYMPVVSREDANKWLKNYEAPRYAGRPSKQADVSAAYQKVYGGSRHQQHGDTWKNALQKVNTHLNATVSLETLKRAVSKK